MGLLWRWGSVARGLAPAGVRSAPKIFDNCQDWGAAAQPSGSKLPRHDGSAVSEYQHSQPMAVVAGRCTATLSSNPSSSHPVTPPIISLTG
ncbi:hypothetical protein B7L09_29620 [Pseudomonas mandelii]|nr:hypothetical protein B7L09_29620 [Pseudomonas mandelii]